jgi:hypothetical protein
VDVDDVKRIEQEMAYKGINVMDVDMCGKIKGRKKIIINFMKNILYENRHMPNWQ